MELVRIDALPVTSDLTSLYFPAMQNGVTVKITGVQLRAMATTIATAQAESVNNWTKNW